MISRIEYLKCLLFDRNLKKRFQLIGLFFAYELYRLLTRLSGYKITHFLEKATLPSGKYLLVKQPVPLAVQLFDKIFPFAEEAHVEHVPYTPAVAEEMKRAGKTVEIIEISYVLRFSNN